MLRGARRGKKCKARALEVGKLKEVGFSRVSSLSDWCQDMEYPTKKLHIHYSCASRECFDIVIYLLPQTLISCQRWCDNQRRSRLVCRGEYGCLLHWMSSLPSLSASTPFLAFSGRMILQCSSPSLLVLPSHSTQVATSCRLSLIVSMRYLQTLRSCRDRKGERA